MEEKTDTVLEDLEVTGVVPLVPPPVIFHPPSLWEKIHVIIIINDEVYNYYCLDRIPVLALLMASDQ